MLYYITSEPSSILLAISLDSRIIKTICMRGRSKTKLTQLIQDARVGASIPLRSCKDNILEIDWAEAESNQESWLSVSQNNEKKNIDVATSKTATSMYKTATPTSN